MREPGKAARGAESGGDGRTSSRWMVSRRADHDFQKLSNPVKSQIAEEILSKRKYKMINGLNKEYGELRLSFDMRAIVKYEGSQTWLVAIVPRKRLPRKIKVLQKLTPTQFVELGESHLARYLDRHDANAPPLSAPTPAAAAAEPSAKEMVELITDEVQQLRAVHQYLASESMSLVNDLRGVHDRVDWLQKTLMGLSSRIDQCASQQRQLTARIGTLESRLDHLERRGVWGWLRHAWETGDKSKASEASEASECSLERRVSRPR